MAKHIIITMAQMDADPQILLSLIFARVSSDPKFTRSKMTSILQLLNIKQIEI